MVKMCKRITFLACIIVVSLAGNGWATLYVDQWNNGAANTDWNNAQNWSLGYVPYADSGGNQVKAIFSNYNTFGCAVIDSTTSPAAEAYQMSIGSITSGGGGRLIINNGGVLNITQFIYIGQSTTYTGLLTMGGGTINCQDLYVGQTGVGTLTISAGTINASGTFSIADSGSSANGTVNLNGGTINAHDFYMKRSGSGTALMDITGGTLIVDGNECDRINGYITNGWITAYGSAGTVVVSYNSGTIKTTVTGYLPAEEATNPSPINGATMVAAHPTLSWTAGTDTLSHDVYFGTANPADAFQGNQSATTFDPGVLDSLTTYYWRIDEVKTGGTVTGNVWHFTTAQLKATNPSPANGATGVFQDTALTWTIGASAVSHDIYFGTANPPPFQSNVGSNSFSPGPLDANTIYYWQVDEKDGLGGTTTGDIWHFTTGSPISTYPYLSWAHDATNSVVVNWWYPLAQGDSKVDYGLTSAYGTTITVPMTATPTFHHVELTGLSPSTTYHYRIRSTDHTVGTDNTFTTADVNTTSFSFVVFGDPRGTFPSNEPYYTRHKALCEWIVQSNAKFAFETGDTVWAGGITDLHPTQAQGWWMDFYRLEYPLAGSKIVMATMGNHEVQPTASGETVTYIYYYSLYTDAFPTNGPANNTGRIYSFDYGNAHFVCLSSYQINLNTEATWLASDLAAARANPNIKWIFAFMHAPLYTTVTDPSRNGRPDCIAAWGPLFDQYVDIVFAGHNHLYERSYPIRAGQVVRMGEGPVYITNGMGGAEFNDGVMPNPLFAYRFGAIQTTSSDPANADKKTVATVVTINGTHLTIQAITNYNNEIIDTANMLKVPVGDFTRDGTVDLLDLGEFGGSWLGSGIWP
jgi:hypothetical protein